VSEPSRQAQRKEQEVQGLKNIHGARVLLVEDNEINQQVAKEILEGAGLNVSLADNGQEAVDAVKKTDFDAVIMDVQMPVLDGYQATRRIRKWEGGIGKSEVGMRKAETGIRRQKTGDRRQAADGRGHIIDASDQQPETSGQKPATRDQRPVPIIAMTAHAMAGDEEKSLQAGMNGHVTKPIDPDQLFATLQKWIKPKAGSKEAMQKVSVDKSDVVQMAPKEDLLPETLPGFDLAAGLQRLLGNKALYRKLLLDFGSKYTAVADEIRKALDAENLEQTHSLVHNIKGLAGNLAATDLQAAAVEMEKLVKGTSPKSASDKALTRKFAALEKALNNALKTVQSLGPPDEEKIIERSEDVIAGIPPELAKEAARRIKAAAEMGDVTELTSIAEELKNRSASCQPLSKLILQLAEDFDFDGILLLAAELDS
jgi:CheY-like chemotaxis protein